MKTVIPINLAVEDELSEAVLRKLLGSLAIYSLGFAYRRGGYGYLRKTILGWNRAAKGIPFLVLTDLDNKYSCPAELVADWLSVPRHPNLLFRVAVREVESWLLADVDNISRFFRLPAREFPRDCDLLTDPKRELVELGRKSKSKLIRDSIVPRRGSTAKQGPAYNSCLTEFVRDRWNFETASANSPSLARTIERLRTFSPVWR
ncbi:MAG: hypothetical protein ACLQHF_05015 [Terracidiphilus sp.]